MNLDLNGITVTVWEKSDKVGVLVFAPEGYCDKVGMYWYNELFDTADLLKALLSAIKWRDTCKLPSVFGFDYFNEDIGRWVYDNTKPY